MELFITRPQYCVLTVSACALLLTSTHSLADTHAAALARVEILEDGRQVARGQWRPLVNHESLGVRIAALKGIARIKDRRLLGLVESQLTHQDAGVRGAAAFALEIGLVDACVGMDPAAAVLDDDHARPFGRPLTLADHVIRFVENQLDQAGVLSGFRRK